mmetsp:Transcript_7039/g.18258  ORF Transcript_7039/g.18258 Transcript_7039/m.18258 type:complete len:266 (-) Transcript_7039:1228-2025(-)
MNSRSAWMRMFSLSASPSLALATPSLSPITSTSLFIASIAADTTFSEVSFSQRSFFTCSSSALSFDASLWAPRTRAWVLRSWPSPEEVEGFFDTRDHTLEVPRPAFALSWSTWLSSSTMYTKYDSLTVAWASRRFRQDFNASVSSAHLVWMAALSRLDFLTSSSISSIVFPSADRLLSSIIVSVRRFKTVVIDSRGWWAFVFFFEAPMALASLLSYCCTVRLRISSSLSLTRMVFSKSFLFFFSESNPLSSLRSETAIVRLSCTC